MATLVQRAASDNYDPARPTGVSSTTTSPTKTPTTSAPLTGSGSSSTSTTQPSWLTNLYKYNDTYKGLNSKVGGLNIASFWDDPKTSANENPYQNLWGSVGNLKTGLSGLTLGSNATDAQKKLYQNLMGGVGTLQNSLSDLWGKRQAEENRVSGFRNTLMGQLAPMGSLVGSLSIRDLNMITDLQGQLAKLDADRRGFSSSILGQMGGWGNFESQWGGLNSQLSALRSKRAAEEQRIKAFEQNLYGQADALTGKLGGLTIADLDGLNNIKSTYENLMTQAGRFQSDLDWDFSHELSGAGLGAVGNKLNQLFQERTNEENRIKQFEQTLRQRAESLSGLTSGLSEYNLNHINEAKDNLAKLQGDAKGFSSLLDFQFEDDLSGVDKAQSRLDELLAARATKLGELEGKVGTPLEGLADIAIHDEDALTGRKSQLQALMNDLGMFVGSDTAGLKAQLESGLGTANAKLTELQTKRTELEKQAQELRDRVKNASYYTSQGLTEDEAAMKSMQDQIELYNAQQAMDELDAITHRMGSERSRLVADEGATAERLRREAESVRSAMTGGVPRFGAYAGGNPFATFFNRGDEDQLLAPVHTSAFAAALGLGG